MTSALLDVRSMSAGYGEIPTIRDVDLEVDAGRIVALLGANGAGKTTTLRAICGTLPRVSGTRRLDGRDLGRLAPTRIARLGVAHVPEGLGVFPSLTVEEHFRLRPRGERLDTGLAYRYFPQLEELAGRRAGLLSGGEQQMLAVSRAMARRPRLLLIDELSLGLAPRLVERLLEHICSFARDSGAGVLIVEQHVEIALEVADHGCVLSRGAIVVSQPMAELRADRELLVSSYLGEHRAGAIGGPHDDKEEA